MGMVLWNRCGDGDVEVARGLKWLLLWGAGVDEGVGGDELQKPEKAFLQTSQTIVSKINSLF